MSKPQEKNLIMELTFQFAVEILQDCDELEARRKFPLANQLFKSGTSIGANVRESQDAESKSDFIHKLKIANKEAGETEYWLLLSRHVKGMSDPQKLLDSVLSIRKVLSKIIFSSKNSAPAH
jgi:four helix bundle protein